VLVDARFHDVLGLMVQQVGAKVPMTLHQSSTLQKNYRRLPAMIELAK
jgi:hypothetical protein